MRSMGSAKKGVGENLGSQPDTPRSGQVPERGDRQARFRVMLVEDHPMYRRGLTDCLNQQPDLMVCGQAATAPEALALAPTKPDLAIVDLSLPDGNGLELIKDLKARHPQLKILVLTMHDESVFAFRALRAGAQGFISKSEPPQEVLNAIRTVLNGEVYLNPAVTSRVLLRLAPLSRAAASPTPPDQCLTDRELEVFELIGEGEAPKAIACHLHISLKTVLAHREHIKLKLRIQTSSELAYLAFGWATRH
jgi:DNA-binding NarL/FixJ family response regulator